MSINNDQTHLPLRSTANLNISMRITYSVALLMSLLSLAGLVFPYSVYGSELLIQTYMTNDLVNLIVGIPILVGSVWFTNKENLAGLLCLPGALLFVIYTYIAYLIGTPINLLSLVYLTLILLSAYAIFDMLMKINGGLIKEQLSGEVQEKIAGWFLLIFGILFVLRAGNEFLGRQLGDAVLTPPDFSVLIADIAISTLWIIGGILLLLRRPLGYSSGLGLLFAASTLFIFHLLAIATRRSNTYRASDHVPRQSLRRRTSYLSGRCGRIPVGPRPRFPKPSCTRSTGRRRG